jgi:CRP/FNR family cyclic AMP-dependent transcriptional regulator
MSTPAIGDRLAPARRAALVRNLLFGALDSAEFDELLRLSVPQRYDREQMIFGKGDPGNGLYAIVAGRVGIKTVSRFGKEIFLNILEAGEVLGEIALLDGKERTAGAVAMEPSELLFISRERFIPFLEQRPKLSTRLLEVLCARLRWTSDIIEDTIFRDVRARLARRLVRLSRVYGDDTDGGRRIRIKLSQENLGLMLGASRESVNKELVALQGRGILSYRGGYITLRDIDALQELAEESR